MISVNFTLVVQAINFLIAYIMIRKLFLRPVIEAIHEDKRHYGQHVEMIEVQRERVRVKNTEIEDRWKECQHEFKEHEPDVDPTQQVVVKVVTGIKKVSLVDKKTVDEISEKTAKELIEKVADVH